MIGRRMVAAGVVVAAVAAGGVAGAVIGDPRLVGRVEPSPDVVDLGDAERHAAPTATHPGFRRRTGVGAGKDVLDAAAKALNLSTADLLKKLSDGKTTIADVAKAQNVASQTVIDAMDAVANSRHHGHREQAVAGAAVHGRQGRSAARARFGGPGSGSASAGGLRGSIDALAKALGITPQDLMTDLGNGQTIADIAKAKSVDINTVINTMVDGRDVEDRRRGQGRAPHAGHGDQDRVEPQGHDHQDREQHVASEGHGRLRRLRWPRRFGPGGPAGRGGPTPSRRARRATDASRRRRPRPYARDRRHRRRSARRSQPSGTLPARPRRLRRARTRGARHARTHQYAPGTPSWVDLQTSDPAGAKTFYSALFGWDYDDQPVGNDADGNAAFYSMATEERQGRRRDRGAAACRACRRTGTRT